jgi:hypothetical protein
VGRSTFLSIIDPDSDGRGSTSVAARAGVPLLSASIPEIGIHPVEGLVDHAQSLEVALALGDDEVGPVKDVAELGRTGIQVRPRRVVAAGDDPCDAVDPGRPDSRPSNPQVVPSNRTGRALFYLKPRQTPALNPPSLMPYWSSLAYRYPAFRPTKMWESSPPNTSPNSALNPGLRPEIAIPSASSL